MERVTSLKYIYLHCIRRDTGEASEQRFEAGIMVGECVRNVCVNLGLDPDTHHGYTRNVRVFYQGEDISLANPYQAIEDLFEEESSLELEPKM